MGGSYSTYDVQLSLANVKSSDIDCIIGQIETKQAEQAQLCQKGYGRSPMTISVPLEGNGEKTVECLKRKYRDQTVAFSWHNAETGREELFNGCNGSDVVDAVYCQDFVDIVIQ